MKVICELSGGADSALAAIYAKRKYPDAEFHCLFVDYYQDYVWEEAGASHDMAVKIFGDKAKWHNVAVGNLFTDMEEAQPENVAKEYCPLRNLVISAIAASLAVKLGAEVIVNGSKSLSRVPTDPYSFRDSTLPFYKLMEAAVNGGIEKGHILIDPILADGRDRKMMKAHVYRELLEEGIQPDETWSCYYPTNGEPCGKCRNCLEKRDILVELVRE